MYIILRVTNLPERPDVQCTRPFLYVCLLPMESAGDVLENNFFYAIHLKSLQSNSYEKCYVSHHINIVK